jgi:UDP-N-acetylglucosamine:LPS N-acetylglucosamine transferase
MSYLNIPSIFTQLTNNQKNNLKFLENLGHFFFLDKKEFFTEECIHLIFKILSQYNRIKKMNKHKKIYLDKKGAKRIKKAIF